MSLIERPAYLAAVRPFMDQPVIKVLTGLRRSGKSSLLELIAADLRRRGAADDRIVHLDFEAMELSGLATAEALHAHLADTIDGTGRCYLLLDEIQEVEHWEKVVNSWHATKDVDLYLTGSNSRLLSSELATYIAGRYVSVEVSTLSFAEHLAFAEQAGQDISDVAAQFDRYQRRGGFPGLFAAPLSETQHHRAVADIYASALVQDAVSRRNVRNVDMLKRVAAFALDNVGNPFSARSVSAFFKSQRRSVDPETVLNYLDTLTEAFVFTKVPRFDLRGRTLLSVNEKYYAADHALIHAVLGYADSRLPGVLENIVAAELRRRGYELTVGKLDDKEVDFVATQGSDRLYVQVTTSLTASDQTRQRELAPLRAINDAYPKLVLSLDRQAGGTDDGIRHLWLPQWLLDTT